MSDIEKAIKGENEAFERVIIQNKLFMYKTAIVILKNEEDAYDAIQEALIRIYKNIGQLKSEKAFKSWSKKILLNCCYDIIERNKKIIAINEKATSEFEEETADKYECEDELANVMQQLDEDLRMVSVLYYYDEMSVKEISETLDIPSGTVKSRLSRAREKLYDVLMEGGISKNER